MRGAVIYGRSSTAKEKSINDQLAECRLAAESVGWTVVAELSDPVSASRYSRKSRENWTKLLAMLPTIGMVILWEPSRGDRTLASWASFLDQCRVYSTKIHAVSHNRTYDPANARDYRSLAEDGVDSAYESDRLSARVKRGKASAAAQGRPAGRLCYGLTRVYDPHTREYLGQEPHPDQAPVVERIFRDTAAGVPPSRIARELTHDGVPPTNGPIWRRTTVLAILRRDAYRPHPDQPDVACREHHGVLHPATWAPLVDPELWTAAHRALEKRPGAATQRPGSVRYLLSGSARLMSCPCGSPLGGRPGDDRPGKVREPAYTCATDWCVSAPMKDLDEVVTRLVVARLSREDARAVWAADDKDTRKATKELARLQADLDEALELFTEGTLSARAYAAKETVMLPAIADAEHRSRPAGAPLAALQLIDAAALGAEHVRPVWTGLTVTAQREVIAALVDHLVLNPVSVRITKWTPPEERLRIVAERITLKWR